MKICPFTMEIFGNKEMQALVFMLFVTYVQATNMTLKCHICHTYILLLVQI